MLFNVGKKKKKFCLIPLLHFKLALYVFEEKQSASTVYSKMCDDATQNIKILDLEKV